MKISITTIILFLLALLAFLGCEQDIYQGKIVNKEIRSVDNTGSEFILYVDGVDKEGTFISNQKWYANMYQYHACAIGDTIKNGFLSFRPKLLYISPRDITKSIQF